MPAKASQKKTKNWRELNTRFTFEEATFPAFLRTSGQMGRTEVPRVNPSPNDREAQQIWNSRKSLQAERRARELSNQLLRAQMLADAASGSG